jgi:hypothetical protein
MTTSRCVTLARAIAIGIARSGRCTGADVVIVTRWLGLAVFAARMSAGMRRQVLLHDGTSPLRKRLLWPGVL